MLHTQDMSQYKKGQQPTPSVSPEHQLKIFLSANFNLYLFSVINYILKYNRILNSMHPNQSLHPSDPTDRKAYIIVLANLTVNLTAWSHLKGEASTE